MKWKKREKGRRLLLEKLFSLLQVVIKHKKSSTSAALRIAWGSLKCLAKRFKLPKVPSSKVLFCWCMHNNNSLLINFKHDHGLYTTTRRKSLAFETITHTIQFMAWTNTTTTPPKRVVGFTQSISGLNQHSDDATKMSLWIFKQLTACTDTTTTPPKHLAGFTNTQTIN